MIQKWFVASSIESPIVHGAQQSLELYSSNDSASRITSDISQSLLHAPLTTDILALSSGTKEELFPNDFPAPVVRYAMAEGFKVPDIIAVMRGLQAQGKDISNPNLVVHEIENRTPLLRNSWKSERLVRAKSQTESVSRLKQPLKNVTKPSKLRNKKKNPSAETYFLSNNLLHSIPGGMNGSIDRLLLVAALKCFDVNANAGAGTFAFPLDFSEDPWQSYLNLSSPLLKVRSGLSCA